jgi:hypothetical protein
LHLNAGLGEAEGPGMVDEEDVLVRAHALGRRQQQAALPGALLLLLVLAWFDAEEGASVEEISGELVEQPLVQGGRHSRRC